MAMKMRLLIFLLIVGGLGGSYASTADSPALAVRAQRAESNAAIKAHDAVRLRKLFDDDYHGIQGTSGDLDSGGEATSRSYADCNVDPIRRHLAPEIRSLCDIGLYRERDLR
jgi:hypothetical protein